MPVTRSRGKVQSSDDSEEDSHSQASSSSPLNKQSENDEQDSKLDDMAKSGELPSTIKDELPEISGSELRTSTALALLILIFLTSALALGAVYLSFPNLEP